MAVATLYFWSAFLGYEMVRSGLCCEELSVHFAGGNAVAPTCFATCQDPGQPNQFGQ